MSGSPSEEGLSGNLNVVVGSRPTAPSVSLQKQADLLGFAHWHERRQDLLRILAPKKMK